MALGAQRRDAFWGLLSRVGGMIAIGAGLGFAVSLLLGRTLELQLYEIEASDPRVLVGPVACLLLGALAAAAVPAKRAAGVSPMKALRYE